MFLTYVRIQFYRLRFLRISLSIQATNSDGIFLSLRYLYAFLARLCCAANMKQMINVMANLVVTSKKLGCNNGCFDKASRIGILLKILPSDPLVLGPDGSLAHVCLALWADDLTIPNLRMVTPW